MTGVYILCLPKSEVLSSLHLFGVPPFVFVLQRFVCLQNMPMIFLPDIMTKPRRLNKIYTTVPTFFFLEAFLSFSADSVLYMNTNLRKCELIK